MSLGNPPMLKGTSAQFDLRYLHAKPTRHEFPEATGILARTHDPTELVEDCEEPKIKTLRPPCRPLQETEHLTGHFPDFLVWEIRHPSNCFSKIKPASMAAANWPRFFQFNPEISPMENHWPPAARTRVIEHDSVGRAECEER